MLHTMSFGYLALIIYDTSCKHLWYVFVKIMEISVMYRLAESSWRLRNTSVPLLLSWWERWCCPAVLWDFEVNLECLSISWMGAYAVVWMRVPLPQFSGWLLCGWTRDRRRSCQVAGDMSRWGASCHRRLAQFCQKRREGFLMAFPWPVDWSMFSVSRLKLPQGGVCLNGWGSSLSLLLYDRGFQFLFLGQEKVRLSFLHSSFNPNVPKESGVSLF